MGEAEYRRAGRTWKADPGLRAKQDSVAPQGLFQHSNKTPCVGERGVALVTAMLVAAIVATLATYISLNQQIWLRQAQNLLDLAQANVVTRGAFELGIVLLIEDAKNSDTDNLTETWAKPLPVFPVEGGLVTAAIRDAQAFFNLNNLARGTPQDSGIFRRLLQSQGLDPNLTDALLDWLDADANLRPGGAEDMEYLALPAPYRAANQSLYSVEELHRVKGFNPEIVNKLRPWITVLPTSTPVNMNTAPAEVMSALCGVPLTLAQEWVQARLRTPFTVAQLPPCTQGPPGSFGVKAEYFEILVDTRFGHLQRSILALIHRPGSASGTKILWQGQRPSARPSPNNET